MWFTGDFEPWQINNCEEGSRSVLYQECVKRASLVTQKIKSPPSLQETWVQFLGWEDPVEKEMATHSNILVWEIPRTEEPGRLQFMWLQKVGHD